MKQRVKIASELVGRRTGKRLLQGKVIRKLNSGADMFEDYFSDSSNESKVSEKTNDKNNKCQKIVESNSREDSVSDENNMKIDPVSCKSSMKIDPVSCKSSMKIDPVTSKSSRKIDPVSSKSIRKIDSVSDENNMKVDPVSSKSSKKSDRVSKESSMHIDLAVNESIVQNKSTENVSLRSLAKETPVRKCKKTYRKIFSTRKRKQGASKNNVLREDNQRDLSNSIHLETPEMNFGETSSKGTARKESGIVTHGEKQNTEIVLNIVDNPPSHQSTSVLKNRHKIKQKTNHQQQKSPVKSIRKESESVKKQRGTKKSTADYAVGIRSSTRVRHAPLEFWRNERLLYRFTESGDIESLGIEPGTKNYCTWDFINKNKQNKEKTKEKRNIPRKHTATHPVYEKGLDVIDCDTSQEVKAKIIIPYQSLVWKKPDPAKHLGGFSISKTFDTSESTFGYIKIQGLKKKPAMSLMGYDAVFVIIKGTLEVTIHHTSMILTEEDTFLVPSGNSYSLQNLESTEAILTFMATVHSFFHELKL